MRPGKAPRCTTGICDVMRGDDGAAFPEPAGSPPEASVAAQHDLLSRYQHRCARIDHLDPRAGDAAIRQCRPQQGDRSDRIGERPACHGTVPSGVSAAIRICPLAATKKTPWPSQSVTGFR